jgi:GDP-L-fucose synthase
MKNKKIFIAGHKGLVGSAIYRQLTSHENIPASNIITRDRSQLNLLDALAVRDFFLDPKTRPDHVYLAAARVGGIHANQSNPVEFLLENLKIQNNIIESAYQAKIEKLLFLVSSCIYPKNAPQPIPEDALLTSRLKSNSMLSKCRT